MRSWLDHLFILALIYLMAAFFIILSRFLPIEVDGGYIVAVAFGLFGGYLLFYILGDECGQ